MSNREILTKAIEKAIASGWTEYGVLKDVRIPIATLDDTILIDLTTDKYVRTFNYQFVIFNHDFAKALWPGATGYINSAEIGQPATEPVWLAPYKYHLQQMVLADDPIKYLGDNL